MTHAIEHSPEAIAAAIINSYTGDICSQTLQTRDIFLGFSAIQGEQIQWTE